MRLLTESNVYPWVKLDEIYFRGYFICNDILYKSNEAIMYLLSEAKNKTLEEVVLSLNGIFSIIIETETEVVFTVDRVRGLPLFYAVENNELYISDTAYKIGDALRELNWDDVSVEELRKTYLFIGGNETLFKQIKQVQASEICYFTKNNSNLRKFDYFKVFHCNFIYDENKLKELFTEAYKKTAENLVRALNGRTAVIPLSGGADSRMIASMLKNQGYNNVICYTYGKAGNSESKISQDVAKKYEFQWIMAAYTNKMWRELHNDRKYCDYKMKAASYIATPHIQDYLAVKILKEGGKLPNDAVFIPGHSGDMIAGSHITKEFVSDEMSEKEFYSTIYKKFYRGHDISTELIERIIKRFNDMGTAFNNEDFASYSEWYNLRNRQSKFIINSVRVYEHFDYEWLVPLWDNNLFEFWKIVPIEWRYQRKLYFAAVDDKMKSTNDSSTYKSLSANIRKFTVPRKIARRVDRIAKYFNSKFGVESEFKFCDYLKAVFKSDDYFCMEQIYLEEYLKLLTKTSHNIVMEDKNIDEKIY